MGGETKDARNGYESLTEEERGRADTIVERMAAWERLGDARFDAARHRESIARLEQKRDAALQQAEEALAKLRELGEIT